MAKRVKISTKTTRNKGFNSYKTGTGTASDPYVINTVTSTTATQDNPNIRLLDLNQAIVKSGADISGDARSNMTLIEATFGFDTELAKKVADLSFEDPESQAYKEMDAILKQKYNKTLADVKNMVIDYSELLTKNNYYIFGAPEQQVLNNRQHYNNCGIESTLNNLAMAGIIKMDENLKDQGSVEKSFLQGTLERNLANDSGQLGVLDEPDGGTLPDDYRDIMGYHGINSTAYYITNKADDYVYPKGKINELAYKISQGYGAVLGVSSDVLWNETQSESGGGTHKIDHAVAITGVVYDTTDITPADPNDPSTYVKPVGFYIHDTGAWMTRFISYDDFVDVTLCDYVYGDGKTPGTLTSLTEYDSKTKKTIPKTQQGIFATITDEPIKTDVFNLNATGDKYDNIIWGNNSDNVIKGMKGDDTLYGSSGQDTLSGGAGHDTLVGNNAFKFVANVGEGTDKVTYTNNTIDDFKGFLKDAGVLDDNLKARLNAIKVDDFGTKDFADYAKAYEYIREHFPNGINTLDGGDGNDIIIGGEQADLIYGGKGNDYIYGGDGRNAIYGGANNDVIVGGYDNDRLFGDAGNDIIYGLDDMDVIDGGAGNDIIIGGRGSDSIETGKGNDIVCFEGTEFGQDSVMSKAGGTLFKFVDEGETAAASKVSDFYFSLKNDDNNNKVKHLTVQYRQGKLEDNETGITFSNYLTVKSGKTKSLYVESEDGIYTTSVSKNATAKVSNVKDTGKTTIFGEKVENSKINNILMTTYEGATITTSKKNDIVTMINNGNATIIENADKITYTGGKDKYVSEDRNTHYTVGALGDTTNLSIYDNVIGVTKVINPESATPTVNTNYASTDDKLYLGSEKTDVKYLFDVGISGTNAITTANSGLYLLNGKTEHLKTDYVNVVKGTAEGGFIYMDSFLKYDKSAATQITGTDFYGNGQIEEIYYNSETAYDKTTDDLTGIASQVASWLNTYNNAHIGATFDSAFDAFKNGDDAVVSALTNLYAGTNV